MVKKKSGLAGSLLILLAGVLWGSIGVFVKELNRVGATGEVTNFLRQISAFVLMIPVCLVKGGPRSLKVSGRTLLSCLIFGVVCHGLTNICYTAAVNTIGMSSSVVLLYLAPVFTMIFSILFFKEKMSVRKVAAIFINILGCILTVTNGVFDFKTLAVAGILFGVGSGFCYGLAPIVWKFTREGENPYVVNLYSFLFAAIFLGLWMKPWQGGMEISGRMIFWGVLFGLVATAAAYTVYYMGLQIITESSRVPVIASIEVVVATLFGILLYSENIGVVGLIGIVLVLASIAIMNLKKKSNS